MSYRPTSLWYEGGADNWTTYARVDGEIVDLGRPFKPYCFALARQKRVVEYYLGKLGLEAEIEDTDLKTLDGEPVIKLSFNYPKHVARFRNNVPSQVKTFEADIPYARNVMKDLDIHCSTDYRIAYFDLELWDDPNSEHYLSRIVAYAVVDSEGHEDVKVCLTSVEERSLVESLLKTLEKYDMVVYYSGTEFDYQKLKEACRRLKIPFRDKQWIWLDYLSMLKWLEGYLPEEIAAPASWKLDYIASRLLGVGRRSHTKKICESSIEEIEERVLWDARLLKMIDERLMFCDLATHLASLSYVFPDDVVYISRVIDILVLKKARELGYVLPNKRGQVSDKDLEKYSGALILQPPEPYRVYENVACFDVASMYPNIVIGKKISPDPEKRIFPELLSGFVEQRLYHKHEYAKTGEYRHRLMSDALKILVNAWYGYLGLRTSRVFSKELAEEVTKTGRECIKILVNYLTKLKLPVIYADTDSVFIYFDKRPSNLDLWMRQFEKLLSNHVSKELGFQITLEADKFFSKIYFPAIASKTRAAKKKYAGIVVWEKGKSIEPKMVMVGMEAIRSDYPEAARKLQRELVKMMFDGDDGMSDFIEGFRKLLFGGQIPIEELALSKEIRKLEYKTRPPHVKAAEIARSRYGVMVMPGDKVMYVMTKRGAWPIVDGANDIPEIDANYYWNRVFKPLIERTVGDKIRRDNLDMFLG